ncbi:MAG: YceI family protein [Salinivenus sp.]
MSTAHILQAVCVAVAFVFVVGERAASAQQIHAEVDSTASEVDYTGEAPLHDWTGTSRRVQGTFRLVPDAPDSSRVVVRVPVASFDSGNNRRDRKMREVTEADAHPVVEFRGTEFEPAGWGRGADGPAGRWAVTGDLTFHGQTHALSDTVRVRSDGETVRADAEFPVSLTQFEVERPGFMGVTVKDTIRIEAEIVGTLEEK